MSNHSFDPSHITLVSVVWVYRSCNPWMHCWLQILAEALEKSEWQPKWWGSLSEWIMDNPWMPLGGRSHMTIIILSYKPLVPNPPTPPALFKSLPPASTGKSLVFVFQTHIFHNLNWETVTEGWINYVFLSYFTWNYILNGFDHNWWLILPIIPWLPRDLQIFRPPHHKGWYDQRWKLYILAIRMWSVIQILDQYNSIRAQAVTPTGNHQWNLKLKPHKS